MGLISAIKGLINPVDGIMDGVKDIVGMFTGKLPPDEQAKLNVQMALLEAKAVKDLRDHEVKIEELYLKDAADMRSMIKVELQSEDAFVRRARPAWLWGLLAMYIINYPVMAVVHIWMPTALAMIIPWEVHMLAGTLVGGYGYLRSVEKTGQKLPFNNQ